MHGGLSYYDRWHKSDVWLSLITVIVYSSSVLYSVTYTANIYAHCCCTQEALWLHDAPSVKILSPWPIMAINNGKCLEIFLWNSGNLLLKFRKISELTTPVLAHVILWYIWQRLSPILALYPCHWICCISYTWYVTIIKHQVFNSHRMCLM